MTDSRTARRRSDVATCGGCAARWTALGIAHCGACHRTFGGLAGFDRHRLRGACVDPAGRGLLLDDDGIWRQPMSEAAAARLRSAA